MNYPLWDLPASGLLIAVVAIVHVFVSHFAVGGGLFLVVTERKARREADEGLLAYIRDHTRFFTLLTLVFGALTGVGIWFTIGLVHPAATSSLINIFVWGWAIEWTFFVIEIAAAIVYFYGWDRLDPRTHMAIGWIYFWAAWLSLVVINGILSFMLTPGAWVETRSFWDAVLNPTYLPSLAARTCGAVGLAGVYALLTATRIREAAVRARVARYAVVKWIAPMIVLLPLTGLWTLEAAAGTGVPVSAIVGAADGGFASVVGAMLRGSASGHPIAQHAARILVASSAAGVVLCALVFFRRRTYGAPLAVSLMLCAFAALGASEFVREDLRKPFVIGGYMYVNGVRLPDDPARAPYRDAYTVTALDDTGVLTPAHFRRDTDPDASDAERVRFDGSEVFRLQCSSCHTLDGYLAIRPLVKGLAPGTIDGTLKRLSTWRNRRMPPFVGTADERRAVAMYLASVGGASAEALASFDSEGDPGARFFTENCAMCHGTDGEFTFDAKGRSADALYEMLGRLATINEMMAPLEATEEQRHALAEYLATLKGKPAKDGAR